LNHALGITRLATFQADQVLAIGRIGPKDVEAIPARVCLQLHGMLALDPSAARNGRVQQMSGIQKIDLAAAC